MNFSDQFENLKLKKQLMDFQLSGANNHDNVNWKNIFAKKEFLFKKALKNQMK